MKRLLAIAAAAAIMAMAGTAMAGGTGDLAVEAEVIGVCTMTGGTLTFADLDPTAPTNVTAHSSGVSVTCTNGTTYVLHDNGGSHDVTVGGQKRLLNGTSNYIAYSIAVPAGGTGTGSVASIDISGSIASTAYTTAPAGTYNDIVHLSVTP